MEALGPGEVDSEDGLNHPRSPRRAYIKDLAQLIIEDARPIPYRIIYLSLDRFCSLIGPYTLLPG
jgi:hypothetical protein